jgi:hypothetical protein
MDDLNDMEDLDHMNTLTYCEHCFINMEDDFFDFRFEYPICLFCAPKYELLLEWVS